MNIIHTSDWHIGQTFYDYDRSQEHLLFFDWLKGVIQKEEVDLLLISGDIFDSSNPSAKAQSLYYNVLKELTTISPNLQIVIIAGNHDSAARLEAPSALLEEMNISVRGVVKRDAEGEIDLDYLVVPLYKKGVLWGSCMAVPYLRQGDYPPSTGYAQGVSQLYKDLYNHVISNTRYSSLPIIAMGHLQATGSQLSLGDRWERTIIGGLESVSSDSFPEQLFYTALGHLHKQQRVDGREQLRYAGSPLPFSFAEKNYAHGVTLIKQNKELQAEISRLTFTPPAPLLSLSAQPIPLEEAIIKLKALPNGEINQNSPYLEIKILVEGPQPSLRFRIEEAISEKSVRLTRIEAVLKDYENNPASQNLSKLEQISPLAIANDYYYSTYKRKMPEQLESLFLEVIREVQRESKE